MGRKPWSDKGSRHARGYGSSWDKLRLVILKRDSWLCRKCYAPLGVKPRDHAVDHITPKEKGGTDDPSNLQSLCAACHKVKGDEDAGRKALRRIGPDGYPL